MQVTVDLKDLFFWGAVMLMWAAIGFSIYLHWITRRTHKQIRANWVSAGAAGRMAKRRERFLEAQLAKHQELFPGDVAALYLVTATSDGLSVDAFSAEGLSEPAGWASGAPHDFAHMLAHGVMLMDRHKPGLALVLPALIDDLRTKSDTEHHG